MTETNFKHTDLGLIPHDWEVKTLGEIYNFRYGDGNTNPNNGGKYPVYGANGIIGGYNKYNAEDSVVIGHMGEYAGSVLWAIGKHFVTYNGTITAVKDSSKMCDKFGYFAMLNANIKRICAGSGQPFLSYDILNRIKLTLPPTLAEQERIAGALSSIDTLIGALTEQIEKKRHIKQGAMQQLLTGKKRLAGFTGEWKTCKIKDIVGTIKRGQGLQSKDYVKGNIPVVAGGKQYAGYHNVANHLCNTITISGSGANAGYVALHTVPIFATDCSVIDEKDDFVLAFVYFVLLNKQSDIYKLQSGGAQPHIYPKNIEEIVALFPPTIAEQSAIAAVLSNMDTEIAALEQKRDKYIAIKSGMMQNLLTGKIRLV